ncbi:MAG: hypothetical protein J0L87_07255 [Bacteroidetes bacterium]|nr:hypothetical protein [Bacteroidota bacterium]
MKLSEFKNKLTALDAVQFVQVNGQDVPPHFHITEVGVTTKNFIDCGGTVREEKYVNFQLWEANDFDHRLAPAKLLNIIALSERAIGINDAEVEIEYQSETIGRYGVEFDGNKFVLLNKQTNCLAQDKCGIPAEKLKVNLTELQTSASNCCSPNSGCCN